MANRQGKIIPKATMKNNELVSKSETEAPIYHFNAKRMANNPMMMKMKAFERTRYT